MVKIGRKLYFDVVTGEVLVDTGERQDFVVPKTVEQDIATYKALTERTRGSFDYIELAFGEFAQDFRDSIGFRINPETKTPEFSYPDPDAPAEPVPKPEYHAPISEKLATLKQENTLLKAQNQALTERADFIEDVVAEMAAQVYQ